MKMKIYTIYSGEVTEGVRVDTFTLKGAGVEIPAILIGEEGRGRKLGVLPVQLLPEAFREWKKEGSVNIHAAKIGTTRAGKPKLFQTEKADSTEKCICVFRTMIGYRGGNAHTGDLKGVGKYSWGEEYPIYHPFPGEIICEGVVAQGDAGRMGSGDQLVAVIPKGVVFRTAYSGRLYGYPSEHYYIFDGDKILSLSGEEREVADLF